MLRGVVAAFTLALSVAGLAGCALWRTQSPQLLVVDTDREPKIDLDTWLAKNAIPPDRNIKAVRIGQTDALSYHIVQIRDREQPHVHALHDLSVTLIRGAGTLNTGAASQTMRQGDVAIVPRGMRHFFVNTGSEPAVAFVTFGPPSDGSDNVPAPDQQ
ncbi:MAG: cupin domain-containing protein [Deltaproteobacteria bacterium]|nr:cupin domain-containing protein [Deltaproteobacteria bacterium]